MNSEELQRLQWRIASRKRRDAGLYDTEERRAYMRIQNNNPHQPERSVVKAIAKRCRIKCLQMGLDPGSTQDMKSAIQIVGSESPELMTGIFHPDYLARTAGSWAWSWRNRKEKSRAKFAALAEQERVDCAQFEPLQPEHD